ncbi:hypothetical protein D3C72_2345690 [compost metagenome]
MRQRADIGHALGRQMQAQIGLVHGRDGMLAHDRMAVDAMDLGRAACAGEQLGEAAIASDTRLAAEDGHQRVRHVAA